MCLIECYFSVGVSGGVLGALMSKGGNVPLCKAVPLYLHKSSLKKLQPFLLHAAGPGGIWNIESLHSPNGVYNSDARKACFQEFFCPR